MAHFHRGLELLSMGNEELVAAVTSRVSRAASSLSSAELVEAAEPPGRRFER